MAITRRILWEPDSITPEEFVAPLPPPAIPDPVWPSVTSEQLGYPDREIVTGTLPVVSGNRHRPQKVRELTQGEKAAIKNELYIPLNGCIVKDACVRFKVSYMPPVIGIFQVTGYVTACHSMVARGEIQLRDIAEYEVFIRNSRSLWASYNSDKYRALRDRLAVSQTPVLPKFTVFPARKQTI